MPASPSPFFGRARVRGSPAWLQDPHPCPVPQEERERPNAYSDDGGKAMSTHFFGIKDWTFSYSHSVGRNEFAGTGFRNPVDLALGADDVVYVINRSYENRPDGIHVTVCTLNEEYITEFGSAGEGDGQFTWPTSIALDKDGNVYVADEWLNRISIFDKDGTFLSKWAQPGSADGELNKPAGLAIADSTMYVSDSR